MRRIRNFLNAISVTDQDVKSLPVSVEPEDLSDYVLKTTTVNGLPLSDNVENSLADLSDDATHRLTTDAEKNSWDNKSDFSGDYPDLTNKPTIPADWSSEGFITADSTDDLSNKTLDESCRIIGSGINAQTGTTYSFVLTDAGLLVTFENASAVTVTIPPNSSIAFPVGARIDCSQLGAGAVTFAEGSGVTINSDSGNKTIGAQYAGVTLVKIAADAWLLVGNLIA